MTKPYTIYIGDAFVATLIYKANGVDPTDLTDITIESSMKDSYAHRLDFTVTKAVDQVTNIGQYSLLCADTSSLKPGKGVLDIKYTTGGLPSHTAKFHFMIEGVVTP